ncbi:MAG: hypothetical protein WCC94_08405 [Candidatus Bathyarchaeia archaeon]
MVDPDCPKALSAGKGFLERRAESELKWKINARRTVASTLGIYGGFYGVEHGYFETLQGNATPSSMLINAIGPPCQPSGQWYGCERAITIIPNFFVTGVVAIIVGLTVMVWAAAFVQRKNGGVVLILLSIIQLFVGGGIGPIFPNLVAGIAGTRINSPLTWWRAHLSANLRRFLAKLWPWSLIVTLLWLPGEYVLGYFLGANNPNLAPLSQPILGLLLLTLLAGFAYDTLRALVPDREVRVS